MKHKFVIKANGGYFDGLAIVRDVNKAKHYDRATARALIRLIMCGNGKAVLFAKEVA